MIEEDNELLQKFMRQIEQRRAKIIDRLERDEYFRLHGVRMYKMSETPRKERALTATSKIPRSDIPALMQRRAAGESMKSIADSYGVSRERIRQIINREDASLNGRNMQRALLPVCPDCGVKTKYIFGGKRMFRCSPCWQEVARKFGAQKYLKENAELLAKLRELRALGYSLAETGKRALPLAEQWGRQHCCSEAYRKLKYAARAEGILDGTIKTGTMWVNK